MSNRRFLVALAAATLAAFELGCAPAEAEAEATSPKPDAKQVASNTEPSQAPMMPANAAVKGQPRDQGAAEKDGDKSTSQPEAKAEPAPGSPGTQTPARPNSPAAQNGGGQNGAPGRGGGGGGFGRGGNPAFMLMNEQIQKELKITADQVKKLQALMPARGQGGPGGPPSAGGPGGGQQMSREEREKQAEETQKKVDAILTAAQKARIKEIQYQIMGSRAFTNPEVAKELGLSADQTKKLEELMPRRGQGGPGGGAPGGAAPAPGGPGGGPGGGQQMTPEERQKRREERMKKALEILTPAQRAKWTKMIGKPFELQMQPRGGGPGRPSIG